MAAPVYITEEFLDGCPNSFTYNVDGTLASRVVTKQFDDDSTTTYTQTYTYPTATTMVVSEWAVSNDPS